jgi:hypothetical protein
MRKSKRRRSKGDEKTKILQEKDEVDEAGVVGGKEKTEI